MKYILHLLILCLLTSTSQLYAELVDDIQVSDIQDESLEIIFDKESIHDESYSLNRISGIKDFMRELDPQNTCLDEYLLRRRNLVKYLGLSPLLGAGMVTGGALIGGILYYPMAVSGNYGIFAPFIVIAGMSAGFAVAGNTFLALTAKDLIALRNLQRTTKLIAQAKFGDGRLLRKFTERINRLKGFKNSPLSVNEVAQIIDELDQKKHLCNGVLRSGSTREKLKLNLAKRRHIVKEFKRLRARRQI